MAGYLKGKTAMDEEDRAALVGELSKLLASVADTTADCIVILSKQQRLESDDIHQPGETDAHAKHLIRKNLPDWRNAIDMINGLIDAEQPEPPTNQMRH
jgi:hypothetical protein